MQNKGVIFDLDGTLWNSSATIAYSWSKTLARYNIPAISKKEIDGFMGMQIPEIFEKLNREYPQEGMAQAMEDCANEQNAVLRERGGDIYENVKQTLEALAPDYKLFIVSNCMSGYIEIFLDYYKLGYLFTDFECWGNTNRPKGENISLVIKRNNLEKSLYIGDTDGDRRAAEFAGIPFIFASYGYGTIESPLYQIPSITSSLPLIHKILD